MRSLPTPRDTNRRRARRFWKCVLLYLKHGHVERSVKHKRRHQKPRRKVLRRKGRRAGKRIVLRVPGGPSAYGAVDGFRRAGSTVGWMFGRRDGRVDITLSV